VEALKYIFGDVNPDGDPLESERDAQTKDDFSPFAIAQAFMRFGNLPQAPKPTGSDPVRIKACQDFKL